MEYNHFTQKRILKGKKKKKRAAMEERPDLTWTER